MLWEIHKDKGRSIVLVAVRVSLSFSSLSNWWMRRSVIKADIRHDYYQPRPPSLSSTSSQLHCDRTPVVFFLTGRHLVTLVTRILFPGRILGGGRITAMISLCNLSTTSSSSFSSKHVFFQCSNDTMVE